MRNQTVVPYLSGIGYATIFGFSFMFTKIGLESATTFQLIGIRFLFALVLMQILRGFKVIKIKLLLKDFIKLLPISIFLPIIYFVGETYGIEYTSSALSGMIVSLIPVLTAGLAFFLIDEKLTRIQGLFMLVSLSGVVIISVVSLSGAEKTMIKGVLFLFLACFSAAFYNITARKVTKHYNPITITYMMMLIGTIVFSVLGLCEVKWQIATYFHPLTIPSFLWTLLFLGGVSSIGAFFLMNFTVTHLPASRNALFVNLETVVSIFAGVIFLKEQILVCQIIGSILIVIGVWGVNHYAPKPIAENHMV